jgi:hypothetical protein
MAVERIGLGDIGFAARKSQRRQKDYRGPSHLKDSFPPEKLRSRHIFPTNRLIETSIAQEITPQAGAID